MDDLQIIFEAMVKAGKEMAEKLDKEKGVDLSMDERAEEFFLYDFTTSKELRLKLK